MNRRKFVSVFGICLIFLSIVSGTLASIAWFVINNSVALDVSGSFVEAYFHCGTGTQNDPFVITRPIHYYHLVEFYQRTTSLPSPDVDFGRDYLYFQVGYDIDEDGDLEVYAYDDQGVETGSYSTTLNMAYYSGTNALLPIGTNEVPFIGVFDGKADEGIVISNLNIHCAETVVVGNNTVNRVASDIGVFGYIADADGSSNPTIIHDTMIDGLTIDLSDVPATVENSDTSISHVNSHSDAHVGYLVGHIHSYNNYSSAGPVNATPLHDVYVNNTRVVGGAGVQSNFGYIGKVDTIDGETPSSHALADDIDELAEVKDGVGQGGSIQMSNMYRRLLYYYRSMSGYGENETPFQGVFENDEPNYAWRVNRDIDIDGNETINSSETTNYMLINSPSSGSDDKKLGTVSLWNRHQNDNNENFMYLTGGRWASGSIEQEVEHRNMRITLDDNNFLTATSTSTLGSTIESSSSLWTISGTSSKISADYNGTTVYLYNNNGNLGLTTSSNSATTWSIESDGTSLSISNGNYELTCNAGGAWSLRNTFLGYKIQHITSGYYLGAASSSSGANVTAVAKDIALIWNYNGDYLQTTDGRYLTCDATTYAKLTDSNSNGFLTYKQNTSTKVTSFPWDEYSRLRTTINSKQYRLRYSSSRIYVAQIGSSSTNQNFSCEAAYGLNYGISQNYVVSYSYGPETEFVSDSGMEYKSSNTSIIPLNVVQDGEFESKEKYYAARKNNGYLTAGSSYSASAAFDGQSQSEVRVSRYAVSRIANSYNSSTKVISNVRTIHGSSGSLSDDQLTDAEKSTDLYKNSLQSLQETLESDSYVYGLHFMNSLISTDNLVKSQYAIINGSVKSNYELPVDVIDFNLHDKRGYVNFFAGTYFSGNNTFFSLHDISRNGNDITEIKEIEEIYSDGNSGHSYVYKYSDGLYSQPFDFSTNKNIDSSGAVSSVAYEKSMSLQTKPSTYSTLAFSTSRIKVTDGTIGANLADAENGCGDTLYYFEIPVHKGEYALGSVPGKNGAYLIYLDVNSEGNQGDFNVENLIASGVIFTQIGMSTGTYFINSVFNIGYAIPSGSSSANFAIEVSVSTNFSYNENTYTCYDIVIVNTSGNSFSIDVLLFDDNDDPTDFLPYMYTITYNDGEKAYYLGSNSYSGTSGATSMTPAH